MVKIKDILKNKTVLFLIVIILLEFILLSLLTILLITTNIEFYKTIVDSLRSFIILTSVLIALIIPFVMKDIETEKEEKELRDRIKTVINELKEYFEIIISSKYSGLPKNNLYIPPQFQFFKFIAKKEPEFLKKLGIDISLYTTSKNETEKETLFEGATLIILNIYRLRGKPPSLSFISTGVECSEIPYSYEFLLKDIIENAQKNFSITLDKDLCLLSDNIKVSYEEVSKNQ